MALSNEDYKDVKRNLGAKTASKVSTATNDSKTKAISKKITPEVKSFERHATKLGKQQAKSWGMKGEMKKAASSRKYMFERDHKARGTKPAARNLPMKGKAYEKRQAGYGYGFKDGDEG